MTSFDLETIYSILFFVLGACLGSFSNVVILRLPNEQSVVKPSSHCPQCKKKIRWFDNIPLISIWILKLKCRNCGVRISLRYFWVELITAVLFLALYKKFGLTPTFVEYVIFSWSAIVVSVIDLDHRILPDVFTLSGVVIGLIGAWLNPDRTFLDGLLGAVAGGGFLWTIAVVYSALKKEDGMGGGDIKLLAWIGAVLGWKSVIFTIMVSTISGAIVGLGIVAVRRSGMKTAIPFGPFLVFAALLFIFTGSQMMQAYISYFFPFVE